MYSTSDFRNGLKIEYEGEPYIIVEFQHVKPGKGGAFVRTKLKNLITGRVIDPTFRSGDKVNKPDLDDRDMEYLYADATGHVFMDQESFDQLTIPGDLIEDQMVYIKPNTVISVQMFEGKPVSVDLPAAVDLLVTDTAPQVKGATATNQLKEAELETGLKTRVPPFIENGEMIRVNTEDGSYISRAGE